MAYFGYLIFRIMVLIFAIIPFPVLYALSDGTFLIIYYLLPYRKKVVISNLHKSFPDKSDSEILKISKKFYHHLIDITFESIKGMSLSKSQIRKRHSIEDIDLLNKHYEKNQSILGVTGHYGNWEWGAYSSGIQLKHKAIAFYKPLSNKYIDQYLRNSRAKFNCTLASIVNTNKAFSDYTDDVCAYIMVADQSPSNTELCYWIDFLGQDTACLHGPEKYSKMYHLPVYYIDIQKVKRGYYKLYLSLISDKTEELEPGELTRKYMHILETRIQEHPEYWLWSHRRWKCQREINPNR